MENSSIDLARLAQRDGQSLWVFPPPLPLDSTSLASAFRLYRVLPGVSTMLA
jgi:hypothetical protein